LPQYDLALTERKEEEKEDNIVWQKYKKQERKKREIIATLRPIQR
jgi:hypothetical protein